MAGSMPDDLNTHARPNKDCVASPHQYTRKYACPVSVNSRAYLDGREGGVAENTEEDLASMRRSINFEVMTLWSKIGVIQSVL